MCNTRRDFQLVLSNGRWSAQHSLYRYHRRDLEQRNSEIVIAQNSKEAGCNRRRALFSHETRENDRSLGTKVPHTVSGYIL